ncbi:hypothetical protein [Buttiauxella izardii]|uniref:Uncharacterized protein n=1 Tax=Buttiauxella izardii TaxID=82991 RepID=A0A3A5JPP0_9ENTR|nr:hypothetical protein [Buttiauxella izardii]RJT22215.1 hypothetical protein D6029_13210 [Buttiauxella izardii]
MAVKIRECRQDNCALAQEYAHIIKCMHTKGKSNRIESASHCDVGYDFSSETQEHIAKAMYNRAIKLSLDGYASDALSCYHALIESFDDIDQTVTKEFIAGAKHNQIMLAKLIFMTS